MRPHPRRLMRRKARSFRLASAPAFWLGGAFVGDYIVDEPRGCENMTGPGFLWSVREQ
jgi:hypothetical protein